MLFRSGFELAEAVGHLGAEGAAFVACAPIVDGPLDVFEFRVGGGVGVPVEGFPLLV